MKEALMILAILVMFGIVGEMDYQDQCRTDPACTYNGWAGK